MHLFDQYILLLLSDVHVMNDFDFLAYKLPKTWFEYPNTDLMSLNDAKFRPKFYSNHEPTSKPNTPLILGLYYNYEFWTNTY